MLEILIFEIFEFRFVKILRFFHLLSLQNNSVTEIEFFFHEIVSFILSCLAALVYFIFCGCTSACRTSGWGFAHRQHSRLFLPAFGSFLTNWESFRRQHSMYVNKLLVPLVVEWLKPIVLYSQSVTEYTQFGQINVGNYRHS